MMKLIYILFFSLLVFNSNACELNLHEKIVILKSNPSILFPGKNASRDCSINNLRMANQVISSVEGKITSHQLLEMMLSKGIILNIRPQTIHLQKIDSIIRNQLRLPANIKIDSVYSKNGDDFLPLELGDILSIKCNECVYSKNQTLEVEIKNNNYKKEILKMKVDFLKLTKAYRLKSFQRAFSQVTKEVVQEEYIKTIPHAHLVNDLKDIEFYNTNKPLDPGSILKFSDLIPIDLVKAGNITDVILENEMVKIKTTGICRRNGSIGQVVEVFHPKRKKSYHGTVIDKNKVKVSL